MSSPISGVLGAGQAQGVQGGGAPARMPTLPPIFIEKECARLNKVYNIEVPLPVFRRYLDERAFLVIFSEQYQHLEAGQKNKYAIVNTEEEVKALAKGRTWANLQILPAALYFDDNLLLDVPCAGLAWNGSSRRINLEGEYTLTVDGEEKHGTGRFIIDTGAPVSQLFFNEVPENTQALTTTRRWQSHGYTGVAFTQKGTFSLRYREFLFKSNEAKVNYGDKRVPEASMDDPAPQPPFQALLDAFKGREGGAVGIIGMDILMRCDFYWLPQGVVLIPNEYKQVPM